MTVTCIETGSALLAIGKPNLKALIAETKTGRGSIYLNLAIDPSREDGGLSGFDSTEVQRFDLLLRDKSKVHITARCEVTPISKVVDGLVCKTLFFDVRPGTTLSPPDLEDGGPDILRRKEIDDETRGKLDDQVLEAAGEAIGETFNDDAVTTKDAVISLRGALVKIREIKAQANRDYNYYDVDEIHILASAILMQQDEGVEVHPYCQASTPWAVFAQAVSSMAMESQAKDLVELFDERCQVL